MGEIGGPSEGDLENRVRVLNCCLILTEFSLDR